MWYLTWHSTPAVVIDWLTLRYEKVATKAVNRLTANGIWKMISWDFWAVCSPRRILKNIRNIVTFSMTEIEINLTRQVWSWCSPGTAEKARTLEDERAARHGARALWTEWTEGVVDWSLIFTQLFVSLTKKYFEIFCASYLRKGQSNVRILVEVIAFPKFPNDYNNEEMNDDWCPSENNERDVGSRKEWPRHWETFEGRDEHWRNDIDLMNFVWMKRSSSG